MAARTRWSTSAPWTWSTPAFIEEQRDAIETTEELDPVTQDMLIAHSGQLEQFHWFIRAHLENAGGSLTTGNAKTERTAARRASKR